MQPSLSCFWCPLTLKDKTLTGRSTTMPPVGHIKEFGVEKFLD